KQCRCKLWAKGTFEARPYQKSLKTASFDRAEQIVRDLESGGRKQEEPKGGTIEDAGAAYIKNCENRHLSPRTIRKYRTMGTRFQNYSSLHSLRTLRQWTQERADDFRGTWKGNGVTLSKALEFVRVMCRFWHDRGWVEKNWFKALRPPKI